MEASRATAGLVQQAVLHNGGRQELCGSKSCETLATAQSRRTVTCNPLTAVPQHKNVI